MHDNTLDNSAFLKPEHSMAYDYTIFDRCPWDRQQFLSDHFFFPNLEEWKPLTLLHQWTRMGRRRPRAEKIHGNRSRTRLLLKKCVNATTYHAEILFDQARRKNKAQRKREQYLALHGPAQGPDERLCSSSSSSCSRGTSKGTLDRHEFCLATLSLMCS